MDSNMNSYTPPPPPPVEGGGGTGGGGGDLIQPAQPPKDPVLILVLNLLLGGCVGYFIMGQKMKGIVAVIAFVVAFPFTCGTVSSLVAIVAAVDGYLQAQQLKAGFPVGQWTFFNDHS
jgi:hypothetical protein